MSLQPSKQTKESLKQFFKSLQQRKVTMARSKLIGPRLIKQKEPYEDRSKPGLKLSAKKYTGNQKIYFEAEKECLELVCAPVDAEKLEELKRMDPNIGVHREKLKQKHPNIIKLHEAKEFTRNDLRLIMEDIDGFTLAKVITGLNRSGETLSKTNFLYWAIQMAEVVQYLNQNAKIIHGDLHIQNWSVRKNGDICLTEFSSAQIVPKGYIEPPRMGTTNTKNKYWHGHSSPEQKVNKKKITFASDIWQLAVCFTSMLNGGELRILPLRYGTIPDLYGPEIQELLFNMHERNPDKRPVMNSVVEELKRIKDLNDKDIMKEKIQERPLSPVDLGKSMTNFRTTSKMSRHKDNFKYNKKSSILLNDQTLMEDGPLGPIDSMSQIAELGYARFKTPRAFQTTLRTQFSTIQERRRVSDARHRNQMQQRVKSIGIEGISAQNFFTVRNKDKGGNFTGLMNQTMGNKLWEMDAGEARPWKDQMERSEGFGSPKMVTKKNTELNLNQKLND